MAWGDNAQNCWHIGLHTYQQSPVHASKLTDLYEWAYDAQIIHRNLDNVANIREWNPNSWYK